MAKVGDDNVAIQWAKGAMELPSHCTHVSDKRSSGVASSQLLIGLSPLLYLVHVVA